MRTILSIPYWKACATALLLVLVVLTSPCSVRNHLERILDVETTEVSNKAKSTSCSTFQSALEQAVVEVQSDQALSPTTFEHAPSNVQPGEIAQQELLADLWVQQNHVPYYILYRNSKYHL